MADELRQLLGGPSAYEGVAYTKDEFGHVQRVYGFTPEPEVARPPKPEPPPPGATYKERDAYEKTLRRWASWTSPQAFMQAGADRNVMRCASSDGLRLVGWIAKYVETGEDPMKALIRMATEAGYDVSTEDFEWAVGIKGKGDEDETDG
jgi:hypothetical protein